MANFGSKQCTNPFGQRSVFRLFKLFVFIAYDVVFSFQNIIKHNFLFYIAKQKTLEKSPILDQNHGLTFLEKDQFFDFLNFFFYNLERCFFFVEYHKTQLFVLYCPKKTWKTANFGQKPWTSPFEKTSIFRLFKLLIFIA